ncbi:MAG: ATP-binding protein [Planctomycetes bacterium]|nr:ATP-binding protein [Planctomycetota bacterium]
MDASAGRPHVTLDEFRVQSFKSFGDAALRLRPLTLLVGPNASGKSNLIEALRLIRWLARGGGLDQFNRAAESGELAIRGRSEDIFLNGERAFDLGCEFGFSQPEWMNSLNTLQVRIGLVGAELRVIDESFQDVLGGSPPGQGREPLYQVVAPATPPSHDLLVRYYGVTNSPQVVCTDQRLVLTQPAAFDEAYQVGNGSDQAHWLTMSRANCLARMAFLDPVPARMRGYVSRRGDSLREDGSNVSGILSQVCAEPDKREQVNAFIRSLPEREILGIAFDEAPPDEVRVKLVESFGGSEQPRDARVLSDGTLRVLAIAAAAMSVPEWSVVVIEEVDSGIHPSRAEALLRNLRQVALERHLSVLLTSHNPALLDALPDEALAGITYCYRDPLAGFSRLVQLYDRPDLLAQGPVGRLMFRGIIEKALKDTRSDEERTADALAWIEGRRGASR